VLTQLQIERFRGLGKVNLERAAQVNLVVGRNDSGKSSFLEAVRVLLTGDPRHLRRSDQNPPNGHRPMGLASFRLAFFRGLVEQGIQISGTLGDITLQAKASIADLENEQILVENEPTAHEETDSLLEKGKEVIVRVQVNGGVTATISIPVTEASSFGAAQRDPQYSTRRSFTEGSFPKIPPVVWLGTSRVGATYARRYSDLYRQGGAAALLEVLKRIEPTLEDLIVLSDRKDSGQRSGSLAVLEVKLDQEETLPLESMGDGFASVIAIVTATASAGKGICLMDEIENGIHYSILPSVWTAVNETAGYFDSQVWATTHSLDCVLAAHTAFASSPTSLLVHRFERRSNGDVKIHTFDYDMLGRALERGLEVR
jgi:hypothetical protein